MSDERTHTSDCDWHVDQYPWECTCGFIPRKKAMDNLIAQDADLIAKLRGGWNGWTTLTEIEAADLIETQAREIERLQEACERVKCAAVSTAKIRLAKRERELEVCGSNMSRAKMKCRADEAAILLGELRALDVAAIIGDSHD